MTNEDNFDEQEEHVKDPKINMTVTSDAPLRLDDDTLLYMDSQTGAISRKAHAFTTEDAYNDTDKN